VESSVSHQTLSEWGIVSARSDTMEFLKIS